MRFPAEKHFFFAKKFIAEHLMPSEMFSKIFAEIRGKKNFLATFGAAAGEAVLLNFALQRSWQVRQSSNRPQIQKGNFRHMILSADARRSSEGKPKVDFLTVQFVTVCEQKRAILGMFWCFRAKLKLQRSGKC